MSVADNQTKQYRLPLQESSKEDNAFANKHTKEFRTRGEWVFGKLTNGAVNFGLNSLLSIALTYFVMVKKADWYKKTYESWGDKLESTYHSIFGGEKFAQNTRDEWGKTPLNLMLLGLVGHFMIPIMKTMEDHKSAIVRKTDQVLDMFSRKKPDMAEIGVREKAYTEMDIEPKPTYGKMIKSRALGWLGINWAGTVLFGMANTNHMRLGQMFTKGTGKGAVLGDIATYIGEGAEEKAKGIAYLAAHAKKIQKVVAITVEELWGCAVTSIAAWAILKRLRKENAKTDDVPVIPASQQTAAASEDTANAKTLGEPAHTESRVKFAQKLEPQTSHIARVERPTNSEVGFGAL